VEDEPHIFIRSVPISDIGLSSTIMTNINFLCALRLDYREEERSGHTSRAILKILLTREDFPTPLYGNGVSPGYWVSTKIPTFPMTTIRNLCDQEAEKDLENTDGMRRTVGMQQEFYQPSMANQCRSWS
jgi:hypothetical protein